MHDSFSRCHPAVNFLYFALVIAFSMCLTHPAALGITLAAAVGYLLILRGWRGLTKQLRWLLPTALLAAVLNPAFSHQGVTILGYLPSGNPLTLESILYGLAAGGILAAIFLWFACYNDVISSDKFIYLFGRIIPALSLVLSMILRFVPRFREQLKTVSRAQKCMGQDAETGHLRQRLKSAMQIFSVMVTWSLESAIETADSMKSRGYGEKGRTAFSIYRMDDRDRGLVLWLGFCGVYLTAGGISGGFYYQYYPMVQGAAATPLTVSFFTVYGLMAATPILLELYTAMRWKHVGKEGKTHE